MERKCFVVTLAVTLLVTALQSVDCTSSEVRPEFIATADGKAFFVVNNLYQTWSEAKELCKSLHIELAQVDSPAQARALQEVAGIGSAKNFSGPRDSLKYRQFSWDATNEEVASDITPYMGLRIYTKVYSCLDIYAGPRYVQFGATECDSGLRNSLCQVS